MNFFDLFTDNKKEQENNQKIEAKPEADINLEAGKEHIYNLIIVDESGSMGGLTQATITGVNETINTVREAQRKFADKQQHFLTLVTFDSRGANYEEVRTLINCEPIDKVANFVNYCPSGCTPLYDAIGLSVSKLNAHICNDPDATGIVTILTDGLENSSRHYGFNQIKELIESLKEKGWTFSYIGSEHDVEAVAHNLSIDNVMAFAHDDRGTRNSWRQEGASRMTRFEKMSLDWDNIRFSSVEEKIARKKAMATGYYANLITPDNVTKLADNEILVLGSSFESGLNGNRYYIHTTSGIATFVDSVRAFIEYAKAHPEKRFLVTKVGCGHAGYTPKIVASMFENCIGMSNVTLPMEFWAELGIDCFRGI